MSRTEVLHIPDCPNVAPLLERITRITNLPVICREISTESEALRLGLAGSPILLVNGVDPFASPDDCICGLSCRIYRDPEGRAVPVSTSGQLLEATRSFLAQAVSRFEHQDCWLHRRDDRRA